MKRKIALAMLATVFTMGYHGKAKGQDNEGERKVRIEITTNENGSTQHVTREFDLSDGEALEDALREMGVFREIGVINDGENIVIDLKRLSEEGSLLKDMSVALAMDGDGEPGAFLGVYCSNWNSSECEKEKGKDKDKSSNKNVKEGACITGVIGDTPAEKIGLKEGDVITAVGGVEVKDFSGLVEAVDAHQPGEEVEVTYWRAGKKNTAKATLVEDQTYSYKVMAAPGLQFEMPDIDWEGMAEAWSTKPRPFLGVDGEDVENNGGARITEVVEGTNAESMGIEEGDVIKKLNGTPIMSFGTLAELIGEMEPGAGVAIEVQRDGDTTTLHGVLGQQEMPTWVMPEPPEAPEAPEAPMAPYLYRLDRQAYNEVMRREMDQLRAEMDQLRHELRGEVRREMKVVIGTIELNKEETDVLKNKGVTGLDASWQLPSLRCFPNPSNGDFHLEFEVPDRGDLNVDIHTSGGERVYHETISGFKGRYERTLDLSDQSDGTYYLVITQNGRALARKLVKQ